MRPSLFFSAILATSLFAGGAMADRPGEDGGRTARVPVREMQMREVKEMRQVQPAETRTTRVRDTVVTERLRNRGDVVDRYTGAGSPAASKAQNNAASIKAQRNAEKALDRLNARKNQVINCSPTDDSCNQPSRAAVQNQKDAAAQQQKQDNNRQRAEIQKKIDELRAERMKQKLMEKMCQMKANACDANL